MRFFIERNTKIKRFFGFFFVVSELPSKWIWYQCECRNVNLIWNIQFYVVGWCSSGAHFSYNEKRKIVNHKRASSMWRGRSFQCGYMRIYWHWRLVNFFFEIDLFTCCAWLSYPLGIRLTQSSQNSLEIIFLSKMFWFKRVQFEQINVTIENGDDDEEKYREKKEDTSSDVMNFNNRKMNEWNCIELMNNGNNSHHYVLDIVLFNFQGINYDFSGLGVICCCCRNNCRSIINIWTVNTFQFGQNVIFFFVQWIRFSLG